MVSDENRNSTAESGQPTTRIVIVGGGAAGWMTAAMLGRALTHRKCSVTIVDAGDGGIGVGEATIPSIVRLIRSLGAHEADFMRACDATWKLGIQFRNWHEDGHSNWHPFGVCGARIDHRDLFSYWLSDQQRPYHSYSLNWAAALAGKSPHARNLQSPITETAAYAFHLDAGLLTRWLRSCAVQAGVQVVSRRVTDSLRKDGGDVSAVVLDDGSRVPGQLFIDCSGSKGLLIRHCPQDTWLDGSSRLLCDRAVAMRMPATSVVPPYTTSTALSGGWAWDIPLMNRRGVGYVYSSRFVTDDQAFRELQAHVGSGAGTAEVSPRFLTMKVGRRARPWNRNVVAIGLSAGFVEPLESSGLHLVQTGVERLLKFFPLPTASAALQSEYNRQMATLFDEVRDFVQLHYLLSQRDEPFWEAARNSTGSPELRHRLRLYDETGMLDVLHPEAFPDASYYYLLAGNGRLPKRPAALSVSTDRERLQFVLQAILDQNRNALRNLPLHEEMLKHVHAGPVAKAS